MPLNIGIYFFSCKRILISILIRFQNINSKNLLNQSWKSTKRLIRFTLFTHCHVPLQCFFTIGANNGMTKMSPTSPPGIMPVPTSNLFAFPAPNPETDFPITAINVIPSATNNTGRLNMLSSRTFSSIYEDVHIFWTAAFFY